ncbi:MAG: SusC/RagA family TonB-linked outer membrane protein [Paludibacter sp.]
MLIILTSALIAQNNKNKGAKQLFKITVTDENDKVLPNTQVVIGEGEKYLLTDSQGNVTFEAGVNDYLKFTVPGHEEVVVIAQKMLGKASLKLQTLKLFTSDKDQVPLPFVDLKKRNITGSTIVINGADLEKYTGADIRNAFTGLAAGLEVRELNGSPGVNVIEKYNGNSEKISLQIRGRSPMFIVDGVPTAMTEMPLDPSEIESATIIKDVVAKAMYGPVGADGIILIKTYRGKLNERTIKVNVEKGTSIVDRMPGWVNGADYAQLNNLARANTNLRDNKTLPFLYTQAAIDKYQTNSGYDMYYPSNDFRSMMFKNTMDYNRVNISTTGGNEGVRYFSYLGLSNEGDMFKLGSKSDYNRIISRSNLDIKITEQLKVKLGVYGAMNLRRSPVYSTGDEYLAMNSALVDANTTPPIAFPIYANNSPELDKPWYAVTSTWGNNPIGELSGKGFYTESSRIGSTNLTFDFDMSHMVKGLSSQTYMGFNILNQVRKGKAQNYTAYTVTPSLTTAGIDTVLLTKVHDGVDQADMSKLSDYYFQTFVLTQTFKHNATIGKANFLNTLTYSLNRTTRDSYKDDQRQQNFIWSGILNYDNKYSLQGVVNYAGTYSFAPDKRYEFFPSVGASWVVSEEDFMRQLSFLNYFKFRAEVGILGYDNYQAPFYYRDNYTTATSGSFGPSTSGWLGSSTETNVPRTTAGRIGNPDLGWEKRKEFNAGFDATMLSNKLKVEFSYFNQLREGIISQVSNTIPAVAGLGSTTPKMNFEDVRYSGFEAAINYNNNIGDFSYSVGCNAITQKAIYEKVDEPGYRNSYQSLKSQSVNSYYGLTYIGRYQTDAEALQVPSLYDNALHAGDLKYKDMNNDGVIDDNDRSVIGNTAPLLSYSVNLELKYKGIELSVLGTGRAFYDLPLTNSYFWNGWGDGNYSNFVRNNLSTGVYPALTYNKVENNFRASNFWLVDGGYFKIQDIQLAYNLPSKLMAKIHTRGIRIFINGTNLYTVSKVKDVDPESINSGVTSYPLFMNLTGGIKLTF